MAVVFDDPTAARTLHRVVVCLLGADLLLIGLHAATSAAVMAGWVEDVPTVIKITRPQSLPELFNYAKWCLTVACLTIVFLRTQRPIFRSLAVIFTLTLLNDLFSFHESLGIRLAGVVGSDEAGELVAFAGFAALALGLLALGFRDLPPGLQSLAVRFAVMLMGLAAFGALMDFLNHFVSPLGQIASKSGALVEEGGEMFFASGAAAYAVAAWRCIQSAARAPKTSKGRRPEWPATRRMS